MSKLDLKAGLMKSVKAENSHIEARFAKADEMLPAKKPVAVPKEKAVRDTYSMPVSDYELIGEIQDSWLKWGLRISRSEIVRGGVLLMSQIDKSTAEKTLAALPKLKQGRAKG